MANMSFESINYAQKRVRQIGTRAWKLWFTESADGLAFRMLTKDSTIDCYETLAGIALAIPEDDLHTWEDDNEDAHFTELFRFQSDEGSRELAWVFATGEFDNRACSLGLDVPLMPELAG
jgi:hypothetical protein